MAEAQCDIDLGIGCPPAVGTWDYAVLKNLLLSCLPPPKANSYFVCWCPAGPTTKRCYHKCNVGYVWNPVTSTCDLIAPPVAGGGGYPSGFGFIAIFSGVYDWLRKRYKRRRRLLLIMC